MAKSDSAVISEEEMTKLRDAKMLFGGVEVQWQRMTGESCSVQGQWRLQGQRTNSEISGTLVLISRASKL